MSISSISSGLSISGPLAIGSSWLSISGPLTIVVSIVVGIWVSIVSMVGISKVMSISIMSISSISSGLSISRPLAIGSSWLSISGPLAIVVSIVAGIWVSIVSMVGIAKMSISMVTIEIASISRCFSLASNGGKHAQGN